MPCAMQLNACTCTWFLPAWSLHMPCCACLYFCLLLLLPHYFSYAPPFLPPFLPWLGWFCWCIVVVWIPVGLLPPCMPSIYHVLLYTFYADYAFYARSCVLGYTLHSSSCYHISTTMHLYFTCLPAYIPHIPYHHFPITFPIPYLCAPWLCTPPPVDTTTYALLCVLPSYSCPAIACHHHSSASPSTLPLLTPALCTLAAGIHACCSWHFLHACLPVCFPVCIYCAMRFLVPSLPRLFSVPATTCHHLLVYFLYLTFCNILHACVYASTTSFSSLCLVPCMPYCVRHRNTSYYVYILLTFPFLHCHYYIYIYLPLPVTLFIPCIFTMVGHWFFYILVGLVLDSWLDSWISCYLVYGLYNRLTWLDNFLPPCTIPRCPTPSARFCPLLRHLPYLPHPPLPSTPLPAPPHLHMPACLPATYTLPPPATTPCPFTPTWLGGWLGWIDFVRFSYHHTCHATMPAITFWCCCLLPGRWVMAVVPAEYAIFAFDYIWSTHM